MVTSAAAVAVATSAANARSLFRSNVYYVDLGSDHFVITRYDAGQKDNVWDNRDSAAAKHEAHFEMRVRELVEAGVLAEDISSAINSELKVSAGAPFSVTPSIKFYSLSLLLMDALFTLMQRRTFSQLTTLGEALNYVQWNIGTARFRKFLASAEKHRKEKEFRTSGGDPIPIEQWALHTIPKKNEWRQPRTNAVRFMHYCDSYRPIFTGAMNLIQPVTESVWDGGARARQFSEMRLTRPSVESARPLPEGSTCSYFFKNDRYLRYDIKGDAVDVAPAPISRSWHLPTEFQSNIDAAVNWGDGHVYFFKGAGYVRYNIATDLVDVGPVEISRFWTHLPKEFQANIGAAVNWGDGHAYFFKGAGYLRYNIETDLVDVGPTEISRFWKELPAEFQSDLDAVVNWGNGHAYFFKGNRYLRYDIPKKVVDVKPIEISANWNLPAEFQSNVRAVVNWTFPCNIAELLRAAGLTVNEVGDWHERKRPGTFKPIGVMIHHTTPSNLNVLVHGDAKLPGPRCNFYIEKSGLVNVVSSGPANHAAHGAQVVLDEVKHGVAPTATARVRGLPDGPGGNSFFYGLENENRGDGVDPWPEVQQDAMARAAAALCQLHCWNENRVIGHKEWTRRKPVDPTLNMSDFRARVARFF